MAAIRHRIAHGSNYNRVLFQAASMQLVGRRYPGASAGRLLRDWNVAASPHQRWLHTLGNELVSLALQIAP